MIALVVAAVVQLVVTLVAYSHNRHDLLRWDDLAMLWHDARLPFGLDQLLALHNEHRIVIPRLVARLDTDWVAGSGSITCPVLLLLQLLHVVVLVALFRSSGRPSRPATIAAASLAVLLLFSCHQLENFVWRVQLSSVLVYLAASTALWFLVRARAHEAAGRSGRAWVQVALVLGAAVVANTSRADGNLLWPVLALVAWRSGMSWAVVAAIATVGGLTIAGYFTGYTTPPEQTPPWTDLTARAPRALAYACAFLGAQTPHLGLAAAVATGAVGAVLGAAFAWTGFVGRRVAVSTARREEEGRPPPRVPDTGTLALLGVMLFAAGSAAVTAFGRCDGPLSGALTARYATPALLFWAALLLIVLGHLARLGRGWLRSSGWAALVAFVALGLAQQPRSIAQHDAVTRGLERATMALFSRVCDVPALETFTFARPHVGDIVELMRERRLSVFRHGQHELLGQPLQLPIAGDAGVHGAIESVTGLGPLAGGVAVQGWLSDCPEQAAPAGILLTDRGVVVGFGSCRHEPRGPDGRRRWSGYARTVDRTEPLLKAFALLDGGVRAVPLAGARSAPSTSARRTDSLAETMAGSLVGPPPPSFQLELIAALGQDVGLLGQTVPAEHLRDVVEGAVDTVEARPGPAGAMHLRGWVAAGADCGTGTTVLVVDAHRSIVGAGRLAAAPNAPLGVGPARFDAWAVAQDGGPVDVVVACSRRTVCLARPPHATSVVTPADLGGPLPLPPVTQTGWDADSPIGWYLPPPVGRGVRSSWGGSDRDEGTCRLGPIAAGAHPAIVIPVLVGPDHRGQALRVRDAASSEVLADLDAAAFRGTWRLWRVDLPPGARVVVEADDQGHGWGQWLAIGPLFTLR